MKLQSMSAAVAGAAALALFALAPSADAAIVVSQGTVAIPLLDDFTGLTNSSVLPQTSNGLSVTYAGTYSSLSTTLVSVSNPSFATIFGSGYVDITSTDMLDAFGFSVARSNANPSFPWAVNGEVLNGSTVLGTFSMPGIQFGSMTDFGIFAGTSADVFNHVKLAVNVGPLSVGSGAPEVGIFDNLKGEKNTFLITGPASGTPEPATWAMMITGLFGLGSALRRRRSLALA